MSSESRAFHQLLGGLCCAIGERRHPHARVCEPADPLGHVRVDVKLSEAREHVLGRLLGIADDLKRV